MILAYLLALFALPQQLIDAQTLSSLVESARVDHRIPGLALAVVRDGELVFAEGFGLADMESARAADADTLFAIGSTTKALTTTLLAMLGEDGRIAWDDPVMQHLPEFRLAPRGGEAGDVTIRDLVCHRTGFTRMGVLWAAGLAGSDRVLAQATHAEPWDGFRKRFHYNNVMYLAAGSAAAAAGGAPWATQVRQRLLEPLGMESTFLTEAEYREQSRLAAGYQWVEDRGDWKRLPMRNIDRVAPAGAIVSSVNDMSLWLRFLLALGETDDARLISEAALRETWQPQIDVAPGQLAYGMGWMVQPWRGRTVIQHGGNIDGFAAQVSFIPEENLGYVLLSNVTASALQGGSVDLLFGALLEPPPQDDQAVGAEDLARFVGKYDADFGAFQNLVFDVRIEKEKLGVDVPGQMFFLLKPADENGLRSFEMTDAIAVEFESDESGRVRALRMHQAGQLFRLPRQGAAPADWEPSLVAEPGPMTGRYTFEPAAQEWTVRTRDGVLTVEVPGQTEYELGDADEAGWRTFRAMPSVEVRFTPDEAAPQAMAYRETSGGKLELPRAGDLADGGDSIPKLAELRELIGEEARLLALAELGGIRLRAHASFVHQGAEADLEMRLGADGRFWQRVDLGEFGAIVEGIDPARKLAWSAGDFGPYDELSGKQLAEKLRADPRAQIVSLFASYGEPAVIRTEELDGVRCAAVSLLRPEGGRDTAWIELEHGDVLKLATAVTVEGAGSMAVELRFADYREFGGIRFPYRFSSENDASGRLEIVVTTVEGGVKFSAADFAPPQ
ncbi:MAG: serine hydrolase [Planctomycetota bacterium]|nr:serine hydrolase [Planctomycetota bacterium]